MTEMLEEEKTRNATDVDRELELYSGKFLSDTISLEDEEQYAKLLAWRRNRLVKLPPVKLRHRFRMGKKVG